MQTNFFPPETSQNLKSYQPQSTQHTWSTTPDAKCLLSAKSNVFFSRIAHNLPDTTQNKHSKKNNLKSNNLPNPFSFPSLHSLLLPITAPAGEAGLPLLLPWPRPQNTPTRGHMTAIPSSLGRLSARHTPYREKAPAEHLEPCSTE